MLGVVVALWRYPVKSLAAEPLAAADVSWHGFAGDRRWGFVREDVPRNGFRPNVVVDAPGECEDDWVGRELRVGGFRMHVDRRDNRCVVVNFDPDTAQRDPRVLKSLARDGGVPLGVYGTAVEPGRVAVGDKVEFA